MTTNAGGGFALIGRGLGQLLGSAIGGSTWGQTLMTNVRSIRAQITEIRRSLMALTAAQQTAINELAEGINTLAENLDGVLDAAEETKAQLQDTLNSLSALQIEEAREQQLRESLEAAIAQLDQDVVGALQPLTNQIAAMNSSLQTAENEGGSPITPGEPAEPTPDPGAPTEPPSA